MIEPRISLNQSPVRPLRRAPEWPWALVPVSAAVFGGSALVYFHLYQDQITPTSAAQVAVAGFYRTFGFAASFLFLLLAFAWGSIWVFTGRIERPLTRLLRGVVLLVLVGVVMNLGNGDLPAAPHQGALGAWLASRLVGAIGYVPSVLLAWPAALASMLLATDYIFFDAFDGLRRSVVASSQASTAQQPGPGGDQGVELEAAELLKSLATSSAGASAASVDADRAPVHTADQLGGGAVVLPTAAEAESADVQPGPDEVEPQSYRPWRAYFRERRRRFDEAAEPAADAWVPTGPDAQEIEDAEADALIASPSPSTEHAAVGGGDWSADRPDDLADPTPGATSRGADSLGEDSSSEVAQDDRLLRSDGLQPAMYAGAATDDGPAGAVGAGEAGEAPDRAAPDQLRGGGADPAAASEASAEARFPAALSADAAREPTVAIPRPDPEPLPPAPPRDAIRQQHLFAQAPDDALIAEAGELVTTWRRASATFLQRRLRIEYGLACQVLAELAARGIVELEADATHGRVRDA